jgi:hypothetical protein
MYGPGTTTKSDAATAVPNGVSTVTRPPIDASGTAVVSVVAVEAPTSAGLMFSVARLSAGVVWKLVPVSVNGVPVTPTVGVKPAMVGAPLSARTVNGAEVVADPAGDVTPIGPLVALPGTPATSWVALAAEIVAGTPLKVTVFWLIVDEKPATVMVTAVPIGPSAGAKPPMAIELPPPAPGRSIARMLPAAS